MEKKDKMALDAKGLKLMLAGLLVMAAGYIHFRRLVAAPVVIVAGIVVEVIAIVGVCKKKK